MGMIQTTLEALLPEIRDAKQRLKPHLDQRKDMIRHTAGRHYRPGDGIKGPATPENYAYTFKSFVKPQLLFGRPTAKVNAVSPIYADTGKALELGVNAWAKETSLKQTLSEVLDDCFVGFGVTMCGLTDRPHYYGAGLPAVYGDFEQVPMYPFCVRVDPAAFFIDGRCSTWRDARIMGHTYQQDPDDLAADDRNDPEAVAKVQQTADDRAKSGPGGDAGAAFPHQRRAEADRRRVTIHEVYVREHGRMVVIAELGEGASAGVVLRDTEYFGPDEGPFTLWGLDTVAGEAVPLSPLIALWDEFLEVCEHSKAAAESARTHKRIGVFAPGAKDDAKRIQAAKPGTMVPVNDPKGVADFEIGGASPGQIEFIEWSRGRLERNLGFGSAQQGVAGKQTATGEQIANQNSDLRIDRMRDRVADGLADVFRKVAWYFFNAEEIGPMEISLTDDMTGGIVPATIVPGQWQGGYVHGREVPPEVPSDFSDYQFDVDPSSMVKSDDALEMKRAQDELALGMQLVQMGVPVNFRRLIDRYGEKMGTQGLSRILILDQGQVIPPDPYAQPTPEGQRLGENPGMKPAQGGSPGRSSPTSFPAGPGALPRGLSASSPSSLPGLMAQAG